MPTVAKKKEHSKWSDVVRAAGQKRPLLRRTLNT